jgi:hypothetical protein
LRFVGYFDKLGRPFITAYVFFAETKNEGNIEFLIDTGSDTTVLSGADATLLGIDTSELSIVGHTQGVEGKDIS